MEQIRCVEDAKGEKLQSRPHHHHHPHHLRQEKPRFGADICDIHQQYFRLTPLPPPVIFKLTATKALSREPPQ